MVTSWILLTAMFVLMYIYWESDAHRLSILGIFMAIIYIVRIDLPSIAHSKISEMSPLLKLYSLIHYISFSAFCLYISLFRTELVTFSSNQMAIVVFAILFPVTISAAQNELKLYKSYGNNNA